MLTYTEDDPKHPCEMLFSREIIDGWWVANNQRYELIKKGQYVNTYIAFNGLSIIQEMQGLIQYRMNFSGVRYKGKSLFSTNNHNQHEI